MIVFDVNVLLYAHHQASPHHAVAKRRLEAALSERRTVGFAWNAISAFLRIITNPRAFEHPLSLDRACAIVDSWLEAPNAVTIEPGSRHWTIFRNLLIESEARGNLVSDAHLAALAIEHHAALISNDRDFT